MRSSASKLSRRSGKDVESVVDVSSYLDGNSISHHDDNDKPNKIDEKWTHAGYRPGIFVIAIKHHLQNQIRDFFRESVHPINTAMCRMLVFFILYYFEPNEIIAKSAWSEEFRVPPPGYQWLLPYIPISSFITRSLLPLLHISTLFAAIGFCYSASAWMAVALGSYLYGITQCYGHATNYHHVIWLPTLFAASPYAADVLSVDRWISMVRISRRCSDGGGGGDRGAHWQAVVVNENKLETRPASSWVYGIPIKLAMIQLSVLFFFPGFYKLWEDGYSWVFGNALHNILQTFVVDRSIVPLFRLDQYPLLCRLGSLGSIAFELLFPIVVLYPRLRPFLVMMGISFHIGTECFLGIHAFRSLIVSYALFINWQRIFRVPDHHPTMVMEQHQEQCNPPSKPLKRSTRQTVIVGIVLIGLNVLAGMGKIHSWPFSVYPTYSNHWWDTIWRSTLYYSNKSIETEIRIPNKEIIQIFGIPTIWVKYQIRELEWPPLKNETELRQRCLKLRRLLQTEIVPLQSNETQLVVYKDELWIDPEKYNTPKQRNFHVRC